MHFKRLFILIFIICLVLTLATLVSPLTFENSRIRDIVILLTFIFIVRKLSKPNDKYFKKVIIWVSTILIVSLLSIIFILSDGWKTVWIKYRQKGANKIYVGQQMLDIGAFGYKRRVVKVIPIIPLVNWVTPFDYKDIDSTWREVDEGYNPFNWKGG